MARQRTPLFYFRGVAVFYFHSGRQFKLFFLDIGLLLRLSKFPFQDAFLKNTLTAAFKGMLSEQFVVQQIAAAQPEPLWYWARTSPGSTAEVDVVMVRQGEIIPIEIKAGKSGSLKSLRVLMNQYPAIQKAYVLSQGRYGREGKVKYIPLYYAGWLWVVLCNLFLALSFVRLLIFYIFTQFFDLVGRTY